MHRVAGGHMAAFPRTCVGIEFSQIVAVFQLEEVRDMRSSLWAIVVVAVSFLDSPTSAHCADVKAPSRSDAGAATYESLAKTIIAVRETENTLVREILNNYHQLADDLLRAAEDGVANRAARLEAAAEEVSNIANEGNKAVQAIRQRLAKAGHAHNSDADTKEDYMFINSKEKKKFLALAKKIAQLGASATANQITAARKELDELFTKSMAPK
jgi:hypothetical protein